METYEIWTAAYRFGGFSIPQKRLGVKIAVSFRKACVKQFGNDDTYFNEEELTYCGIPLQPKKRVE